MKKNYLEEKRYGLTVNFYKYEKFINNNIN